MTHIIVYLLTDQTWLQTFRQVLGVSNQNSFINEIW